jgi:hypothetical protein
MLIFRAHKSTYRKVLVWPLTRTAARELVSCRSWVSRAESNRVPRTAARELASDPEAKKGPTPKGWPNGGHKKMANPEGLATMSQAEKKKA